MKTLFDGHPELILGFNTFLPKGYEIKSEEPKPPPPAPVAKPAVEFNQAITYVNKIKQRFANDERVYKAFLEILNMYRKGQKTISNVYDEVALLFRNHSDLLEEFAYFLPDNTVAPPPRARTTQLHRRAPGAYGAASKQRRAAPPLRRDDPRVQRELSFFEKVRKRLGNQEAYEDFLKTVNCYAEDIITKSELQSLLREVIGKHHDLQAGLNEFLLRVELGPDDSYARAYQSRSERSRHATQHQKYISLPISELDVGTWERTTPSYVRLPDNYPKVKTSGRDELGMSALNDDWVSVTSGSEDYNFKHYRKNQYEDSLFMAEDDHFELDMLIDQNASTIKALKPLVEEITKLSADELSSWQIPEGALRGFHYRAINRIYGEAGTRIVALLRGNPAVAIPTILPRLEQKDQEWRQTKAEMLPVWQAIFKENYAKSLDHRSFYFKQNEKKNLTPKLLFNDLKEAAEKRRNERVSVMLALTGRVDFAARLQAHITADYGDKLVLEDTARILQMGIDNMLTSESAAKVRTMHHSFLETFFEIKCTCAEAEERRRIVAAGGEASAPAGTTPRAARALKAARNVDTDAEGDGDTATATEGEDDEEGGLAALKGMARGNEENSPTDADNSDEEKTNITEAANAANVSGSEEESDETEFATCRPVVALVSGGESKPTIAPTISPDNFGVLHPHCRIFYGNESLCVLLRLHHILFDRLRAARSCAEAKSLESNGSKTPEAIHKEFMGLVQALIEGRVEPSIFEDDCRTLLGTNSYQLFTVDKLVQKIVKQAQTCIQEDPTARLVELWKYENSRGVPCKDQVYHANARVVLGDEPAVRFEHTEDHKLTLQYMESERYDGVPILEPQFREYVEDYVTGENGPAAGGDVFVQGERDGTDVCLRRNVKKAVSEDKDAETVAAGILAESAIVNGLECKLGSHPQRGVKKIAYVLGTEDYFRRKRSSHISKINDEAKVAKFREWIDESTGYNKSDVVKAPEQVAEPIPEPMTS